MIGKVRGRVHRALPVNLRGVGDAGCDRGACVDKSPRVRAWVKRERLRFEIQYRHGQTMHDLRADLLVELVDV